MVICLCAATATNAPSSAEQRVLCILGSPRKDGLSTAMADAALQALGGTVTRFDCYAHAPLPCDDCRFCHTTAACSKGDLDEFYALLEQADVLLFAAPVYNRSFPAPMKALLDRLQRYWAARFVRGERPPISRPKRTLLLTAGGSSRADGELLEQQLAPLLTVLHAAPALAAHLRDTDHNGALPPETRARIAAAVAAL